MSSSPYGEHGYAYGGLLGFGLTENVPKFAVENKSNEYMNPSSSEANSVLTNKSESKISRDSRSILPLSMKQIIIATKDSDGYCLNAVKLWLVRVFGYVEEMAKDDNCIEFTINDGSAKVNGILWIDNKEKEQMAHHIREGTFVKIVGELQNTIGIRKLMVHFISPLSDWNELTCHLMEIVYVHTRK